MSDESFGLPLDLSSPQPPADQGATKGRSAPKKAAGRKPNSRGRTARGEVPADASEHARKIAKACVDAWWRAYGGSGLEVAAGTLAAMTLMQAGPGEEDPDEQLQALIIKDVTPVLRDVWSAFCIVAPHLAMRSRPIWTWVMDRDPSENELHGALAVLHAAGRYHLMKFNGGPIEDAPPRLRADLLGTFIQEMRTRRERQGRGEFHTPAGLADMIAQMVYENPPAPGSTLMEPAAGTGSLVRAAVLAPVLQGGDPRAVTYYTNEIEQVSAACLAVNHFSWGVGSVSIVGQGNGLTDWTTQARLEALDAIDETAALADFVRKAIWAADLLDIDRETRNKTIERMWAERYETPVPDAES